MTDENGAVLHYIHTYVFQDHMSLCNCLSNALHSSIGQNIKSHMVSGVRYPVSVLRTECEKVQMAITQQSVIRSTSCLVLGWGFQGRRIERHHFRLDQI